MNTMNILKALRPYAAATLLVVAGACSQDASGPYFACVLFVGFVGGCLIR